TRRGCAAYFWLARHPPTDSLPATAHPACRRRGETSLFRLPRVDVHLNGHTRAQQGGLFGLAEHFDAHRDTLGNFHKVTRGVIRRDGTELDAGRRRDTLHAALITFA